MNRDARARYVLGAMSLPWRDRLPWVRAYLLLARVEEVPDFPECFRIAWRYAEDPRVRSYPIGVQ